MDRCRSVVRGRHGQVQKCGARQAWTGAEVRCAADLGLVGNDGARSGYGWMEKDGAWSGYGQAEKDGAQRIWTGVGKTVEDKTGDAEGKDW